MNRLGELERAIMELLWERGRPATVREVLRELTGERELAHTTVMTVLDRLTRKGLLHRERDGRAWRYQPNASQETYIAALMLDALDLTGDRDAALAHFARSVSGEEAELLREVLGDFPPGSPPEEESER